MTQHWWKNAVRVNRTNRRTTSTVDLLSTINLIRTDLILTRVSAVRSRRQGT